jgi:hypothetical protein
MIGEPRLQCNVTRAALRDGTGQIGYDPPLVESMPGRKM